MAGTTGKMTREAIAARGPRMVLHRINLPSGDIGYVVSRYGQQNSPFSDSKSKVLMCDFEQYARSYTLTYLMRIAKAMAAPRAERPRGTV